MTRNRAIFTIGAALGLIALFVTAVRDYAGRIFKERYVFASMFHRCKYCIMI